MSKNIHHTARESLDIGLRRSHFRNALKPRHSLRNYVTISSLLTVRQKTLRVRAGDFRLVFAFSNKYPALFQDNDQDQRRDKTRQSQDKDKTKPRQRQDNDKDKTILRQDNTKRKRLRLRQRQSNNVFVGRITRITNLIRHFDVRARHGRQWSCSLKVGVRISNWARVRIRHMPTVL
jgi:hypothetical protein